jgi:hypothetical protein
MSRPLVVTDCDEVLLHMVRHFRDWLGDEHGIEFLLEGNPFVQSVRRKDSDKPVEEAELWGLLNAFFETEMARQTAIEGAAAAMAELQREADIVVLTNLVDRFGESRRTQLRDHGIDVRVVTNQGPKGEAVRRIVEDHGAGRAVFIDDLAQHHASTAEVLPAVARLHFCGEPAIAPHVPCALKAGHAHARIDTWDEALPWLLETLHGNETGS